MRTKPVYRISECGECPKALAAARLGYEPVKESASNEELLNYASALEAIAADQLEKLTDLPLVGEIACERCFQEFGDERNGVHVEYDTALFTLVGHIDRKILLNQQWYPVEIKSLGRFTWEKFSKDSFGFYPGYAGQEAIYLAAEGRPGLYYVLNRDNGKSLKLIVNDTDRELDSLQQFGFRHITLPVTANKIVDRLNEVEICIQDKVLPQGIEQDCQWCSYRYLCFDEFRKETPEIQLPDLLDAAKMYREGYSMEKTGSEMKEIARVGLLAHARENRLEKFKVGGLSVSYRGVTAKEYVDTKKLQQLFPDVYKSLLKKGQLYEDGTIRILKEAE